MSNEILSGIAFYLSINKRNSYFGFLGFTPGFVGAGFVFFELPVDAGLGRAAALALFTGADLNGVLILVAAATGFAGDNALAIETLGPAKTSSGILLLVRAAFLFSQGVGSSSSSYGTMICFGTETSNDLEVQGSATMSPLKFGSLSSICSISLQLQSLLKNADISSGL